MPNAVSTEAVLYIVGAAAAAGLLSYSLTPVAIAIARRVGAIDQPDSARRVHRMPIARLGGLAVGATFILVGLVAIALGRTRGPSGDPLIFIRATDPQIGALFLGVAVAMLLGFIDDRWQIRARWQLLGQVLLAAVALAGGILFTQIANPFQVLSNAFGATFDFRSLDIAVSPTFTLQVVPIALTTLWIVGMINCINWIDGLDGLSTGVSLIAAVTLGIIALTAAPIEPLVALLCAVLAGSLAGFLPWNFHPARVFIGTAGVMVVGYALSVLSILGSAKVAVALLVLGVPIIDTFWVIIRRIANGTSPFEPDRGHLHHRLLDLGLTHRGAVLLIYGICVCLGFAGFLLSSSGAGPLYAFLGFVVAGGFGLYLLTRRTRDSLDAASYPDAPDDASATGPTDAPTVSSGQAPGSSSGTAGHGTRPA